MGSPAMVVGRAAYGAADGRAGPCSDGRHDAGAGVGVACDATCGAAGGAACGGVVMLVSPHLEDGSDERSITPFVNAFRLVSRGSFYQRWMDGTEPSWLPYRSSFHV